MKKKAASGRETVPIEVSSRVLRHLSRGIYRTPAGALKELVSNSYDAGATDVTINTGYPKMARIVITDNGKGLTRNQFKIIVRNIGFSDKNIGDKVTVVGSNKERTLIGHYGIGLLAVGQLSEKMKITSKKSNRTEGFIAMLDFEQFETMSSAGIQRAKILDEMEIEKKDPKILRDSGPRPVEIGQCILENVTFDRSARSQSFTKIELEPIREDVQRKLSGGFRDINPDADKIQRYSANFDQILQLVRQKENDVLQGLFSYEKLLWELGVYCPIVYPIAFSSEKELAKIAELVSRFDFCVRVDGMKLTKPFEKPFFKDEDYPIEHVFCWMDEPYTNLKRGPKANCYIFYKRRIKPNLLRGILIRESGISIGMYDQTFMEYPFHEGQKFGQLSGEIYADGLSGSLNIDRNSFNETDDTYLALSRWLHDKLNKVVFPYIKKTQKLAVSPVREKSLHFIEGVLNSLATILNRKYDVKCVARGKGEPLLSISRGRLFVNTDHPDGSGSSAKRDKVLLAASLVILGLIKPKDILTVEGLLRKARKSFQKDVSS